MPREVDLIPEGLMVRVAERLRILGQPVRLRLVELLTEGASTPQGLSDVLGLSQQNVSKHLLSLHRAGVVSRRPEGPNVVYALTDPSAVTILRLSVDAVSAHLRDLANLASGALPTGDGEHGDIGRLPVDRGAKMEEQQARP